MPNETTKWLSTQLTKKGYNVGRNLDDFDKALKTDAETRRWAYDAAVKEGLNMGEYSDFESAINETDVPEMPKMPGYLGDVLADSQKKVAERNAEPKPVAKNEAATDAQVQQPVVDTTRQQVEQPKTAAEIPNVLKNTSWYSQVAEAARKKKEAEEDAALEKQRADYVMKHGLAGMYDTFGVVDMDNAASRRMGTQFEDSKRQTALINEAREKSIENLGKSEPKTELRVETPEMRAAREQQQAVEEAQRNIDLASQQKYIDAINADLDGIIKDLGVEDIVNENWNKALEWQEKAKAHNNNNYVGSTSDLAYKFEQDTSPIKVGEEIRKRISHPDMLKRIKDASERAGVKPWEYIYKYIIPTAYGDASMTQIGLRTPINSGEAIGKSIVQQSIVGMMASLLKDKKTRELESLALATYKKNNESQELKSFGEEAASFVGSVIMDAPIFYFASAVGGFTSKALLSKFLGSSFMASGATAVAAEQIASKAAAKYGLGMAARMAGGAANFATYSAMSDVAGQLYSNNSVDAGELLTNTASGAVTGAVLGAFGVGAEHATNYLNLACEKGAKALGAGARGQRLARFTGNTIGYGGDLAGRSFIMSGTNALVKSMKGEDYDYGELLKEAMKTNLGFDIIGVVKRISKDPKSIKAMSLALRHPEMSFTPEQLDELRRSGFEGNDTYTILADIIRKSKTLPKDEESYEKAMFDGSVTPELLKSLTSSKMTEETRNKVLWHLTGTMQGYHPTAKTSIVQNGDEFVVLESAAPGVVNRRKTFNTREEAEAYAWQVEENGALSNALQGGLTAMFNANAADIYTLAFDLSKTGLGKAKDIAELMVKVEKGEKLTSGENELLGKLNKVFAEKPEFSEKWAKNNPYDILRQYAKVYNVGFEELVKICRNGISPEEYREMRDNDPYLFKVVNELRLELEDRMGFSKDYNELSNWFEENRKSSDKQDEERAQQASASAESAPRDGFEAAAEAVHEEGKAADDTVAAQNEERAIVTRESLIKDGVNESLLGILEDYANDYKGTTSIPAEVRGIFDSITDEGLRNRMESYYLDLVRVKGKSDAVMEEVDSAITVQRQKMEEQGLIDADGNVVEHMYSDPASGEVVPVLVRNDFNPSSETTIVTFPDGSQKPIKTKYLDGEGVVMPADSYIMRPSAEAPIEQPTTAAEEPVVGDAASNAAVTDGEAPVAEEPTEAPTAETPAEEIPAAEEPKVEMLNNGLQIDKATGEPIVTAETNPRSVAEYYLDNRFGLSDKQIDDVVEAKVQQALEQYNTAQSTPEPQYDPNTGMVDYQNRRNEWSTAKGNAEANHRLWSGVRDEITKLRAERSPKADYIEGVPDVSMDKPEDAYNRGFFMVNGYKHEVASPLSEDSNTLVKGNETTIRFSNDADGVVNGQYVMAPIDKVIPSHVNGQVNVDYYPVSGRQPKNRTDLASISRLQQAVDNLNSGIVEGDDAYTGAPVIDGRGYVYQGNWRDNLLLELKKQGKMDEYKNLLESVSDKVGIPVEQIDELVDKGWGLYRMVDVPYEQGVRLGNYTRADLETGGSQDLNPVTASQLLMQKGKGGDFLGKLLKDPDPEGGTSVNGLIKANGIDALQELLNAGAINMTQYQSAVKDGKLTDVARLQMEELLSNVVLGDATRQMRDAFESLPERKQQMLMQLASRDMNAPAESRIMDDVRRALELVGYAGRIKEFSDANTVESALGVINTALGTNGEAFDTSRPKFTEFEKQLAALIKGAKVKDFTDLLNKYYEAVRKKNQGMFTFDDAALNTDNRTLTKEEALKEVFGIGETKNIGNEKPTQSGNGSVERPSNTGGDGRNVLPESDRSGEQGIENPGEGRNTEASDGLGGRPVALDGHSRGDVNELVNDPNAIVDLNKTDLLAGGIHNLEDLKRVFETLNGNDDLKVLFSKVFDTSKLIGLNKVYLSGKMGTGNSGTVASYRLSYTNDNPSEAIHSLGLSKAGMADLRTNQEKATDILHELIHHVSLFAIDLRKGILPKEMSDKVPDNIRKNLIAGAQKLDNIFEAIKRDPKFNGQYGIHNNFGNTQRDVHGDAAEMVAELSNPEFRQLLKEKDLWVQTIDAFTNFFDHEVEGAEKSDALTETEKALDECMNAWNGRALAVEEPAKVEGMLTAEQIDSLPIDPLDVQLAKTYLEKIAQDPNFRSEYLEGAYEAALEAWDEAHPKTGKREIEKPVGETTGTVTDVASNAPDTDGKVEVTDKTEKPSKEAFEAELEKADQEVFDILAQIEALMDKEDNLDERSKKLDADNDVISYAEQILDVRKQKNADKKELSTLKTKLRWAVGKAGYKRIYEGVTDASEWMKIMKQLFSDALKKVYKWNDDDVERYLLDVRDLTNVPNEKGEIKTIAEHLSAKSIENAPEDAKVSLERVNFVQEVASTLKDHIRKALLKGSDNVERLNINALRAMAQKNGWSPKNDVQMQEAVEQAIVCVAREIAMRNAANPKAAYKGIVKLYEIQPTISMRSSNRIELQQYSTPTPMSYMADLFAMKNGAKSVLEPTAGNGMMLIGIDPSIVHVNEIDPERLGILQTQGYAKVTNQDGRDPFEKKSYDAIVMNPPFGSSPAQVIGTYSISGLDPQITINALESMKDNGRAAIIVGGNNEYDEYGRLKGSYAPFLRYLHTNYNVVDVVNMAGSLYQRQGTTYPTRMILIDGRKTDSERENSTVPRVKDVNANVVTNWNDLYERINNLLHNGGAQLGDNGQAVQGGNESGNGVSTNNAPTAATGGNTERGARGNEQVSSVGNGGGEQAGVRPAKNGNAEVEQPQRTEPRGASNTGSTGGQVENKPTAKPSNGGNIEGGNAAENGRSNGDAVKSADTAVQPKQSVKVDLDTDKVDYPQRSGAASVKDCIIPAGMAKNIERALNEIGDVDQYLADELESGDKEKLFSELNGPQIEAVALGIKQMKDGFAFINGDQTGMGKGRQAAAVIKWAMLQGKTPIYLTQSKDNFWDHSRRDMVALGVGDKVPFILNSDGRITANQDGTGGVVFRPASPADIENATKTILETGKLPKGYDYLLGTYSQFFRGLHDYINGKEVAKEKPTSADKSGQKKRDLIAALLKDNYFIFDESHNAAGQGNGSQFMLSKIASTKGGLFLSATFAKNPSCLPLYAMKTALSGANIPTDKLIDAISKGGPVIEEIVSSGLSESNQSARRERGMGNVKHDWVTYEDKDGRMAEAYDHSIDMFRSIIDFQRTFVSPVIEDMNQTGDSVVDLKQGTEDMGISNTPFASKVFNITRQLLLALKADNVVETVKEMVAKGQKPLITLENTLEGAVADCMPINEETDAPDFTEVFRKGLKGVLRIQSKNPDTGEMEYDTLSPEDLGPDGQREYERLTQELADSFTGLPLSPIDYIVNKLEQAGIKVAECTGRTNRLEYLDNGKVIWRPRTSEESNMNASVSGFNKGGIDVIIGNRKIATGHSLHASPDSDRKQRVQVNLQAMLDISQFMQFQGRVNRLGQVVDPEIFEASCPIPAEQRLMMMLKGKLKSLSANTTTSQEDKNNDVAVIDFLNKYGDQVVVEMLKENGELNDKLYDPFGLNKKDTDELEKFKTEEGAARKVTSKVALLKAEEQEQFYKDVVQRYTNKVQQLKDAGDYDLEAEMMPLKAKTISSKILVDGKNPGSGNAFAENSYLETCEVDVLKRPMKSAEVKALMTSLLDGKAPDEHCEIVSKAMEEAKNNDIASVNERFDKRIADAEEKIRKQLPNKIRKDNPDATDADIANVMAETIKNRKGIIEQDREKAIHKVEYMYDDAIEFVEAMPEPGKGVNVATLAKGDATLNSPGMLVGYRMSGKKAVPSSVHAIFALHNGRRKIEVPLSDRTNTRVIRQGQFNDFTARSLTLDNWDATISNAARKTIQIATGNILQAYGALNGNGQIIRFTDIEGNVRTGILIPENYDMSKVKPEKSIKTAKNSLLNGVKIKSSDGNVMLSVRYGTISMSVPKSGKKGGIYFKDAGLRKFMYGDNFNQVGNKMVGETSVTNLETLLDYLDKEFKLTYREGDGDGDSRSKKIQDKTDLYSFAEERVLDERAAKRVTLSPEEQKMVDGWTAELAEARKKDQEAMPEYIRKMNEAEQKGIKTYDENRQTLPEYASPRNYWDKIDELKPILKENGFKFGSRGIEKVVKKGKEVVIDERAAKRKVEEKRKIEERIKNNPSTSLSEEELGIYLHNEKGELEHDRAKEIIERTGLAVTRISRLLPKAERGRDTYVARAAAIIGEEAFGATSPMSEGSLWTSVRDVLENAKRESSDDERLEQRYKSLISHGKHEGFWFDNWEESIPDAIRPLENLGATESDVYLTDDGEYVYKLLNTETQLGGDPSLVSDYVALINSEFPNSRLNLEGFTKKNGILHAVLLQKFVPGETVSVKYGKDEDKGLDEVLGKIGYELVSKGTYTNGEFYMTDVHGGNIIIGEDNDVYPIDVKLEYVDRSKYGRYGIVENDSPTISEEDANALGEEEIIDERAAKRTKPEPKNQGTGYKVFFLKDGKLYPPMVANAGGVETEVGVWLDADAAPVASTSKTGRMKVKAGGKGTQGSSGQPLAYRPGWHLGEIPYALQFNRGEKVDNTLGIKNQKGETIKVGRFFPKNFVWAEVKYANDVDYQEEAMSYGYNEAGNFQHSLAGLPKLPTDGSYKYRTNANPATDPWIITGAMKVNKILTPSEVDAMVSKAGRQVQEREEGFVTDEEIKALNKELGLDGGDDDPNGGGKPKKTYDKTDPFSMAEEVIDERSAKRTGTTLSTDPSVDILRQEIGRARDEYDKKLMSELHQQSEIWHDYAKSVETAQNLVEKEIGRKLTDAENAYNFENQMHSMNQVEMENFDRELYEPLLKEVARLSKKEGIKLPELEDYMIAKSGLERNEVLAQRDAERNLDNFVAKKIADLDVKIADAHSKLAALQAKPSPTPTEQAWITRYPTLISQWKAYNGSAAQKADAMKELVAKFRKKDYSGLTSLTGMDDIRDAEAEATLMVSDMEGKHDMSGLWGRINDATQFGLEKQRAVGRISEDTYNKVSTMMNYYIPLRGWREEIAEDMYSYEREMEKGIGSPIHSAKGRKSLAESSLAVIGAMGEASIVQGNRNRLAQHVLNMAQNARTDLFSVSKLYVQRNPATNEWEAVFPDLTDREDNEVKAMYEAWEADMAANIANDPDNWAVASDRKGIPYRINKRQVPEHQMIAYRNGKPYVITINGNPRYMKALKGEMRHGQNNGEFYRLISNMTKGLSKLMTSYSPQFMLNNPTRDLETSLTNNIVRGGGAYATGFLRNWFRNIALMHSMYKHYEKGTLRMSNPRERYFKEFIDNGGQTGFAVQLGSKGRRKQLEDTYYKYTGEHVKKPMTRLEKANAVKKMLWFYDRGLEKTAEFLSKTHIDWLGKPVSVPLGLLKSIMEDGNKCMENLTRFSTYEQSRRAGKTIQEAIKDAKEITGNYNRHGAGSVMGKEKTASPLTKLSGHIAQFEFATMPFINAAIQSFDTVFGQNMTTKAKTAKLAGVSFIWTAMGYLMSALGRMWFGDDEWDSIPGYEKRNKLCIPIGDNEYIGLPLGYQFRSLWAMGDIVAEMERGKEDKSSEDYAKEMTHAIVSALPVYFLEGDSPDENSDMLGATAKKLFIPGIIKPIVSVWTNTKWNGAPVYNNNSYMAKAPNYKKGFRTTDKDITDFTKWAYNETREDKLGSKGSVDLNPAIIEYLMQSYLGGPIKEVMRDKNFAEQMVSGEDLKKRNIPFFGNFFREIDTSRGKPKDMKAFYENKDYASRVKEDFKDMSPEEQKQYATSPEYKWYLTWHEYEKAYNKLSKAYKQSGNEELRQKLDGMVKEMNDMTRKMLGD